MNDFKFIIIKISVIFFALLKAVSTDIQLYKDLGGRMYLVDTDPQYDWFAAFKVCKGMYLQFQIIDSKKKNEAIIDLLTKNVENPPNLWLGGHDDFGPGNNYNRPFFWSATGKKFKFNYWSDNNGGVNESEAHCVHISNSTTEYRWNRANCKTNMGYICEVMSELFS